MLSSTPVIVKGAELTAPTGIVIVAGTVASVRSLLSSTTSKGTDVSELRLTIAVVVPPFSEIESASMVTVSCGINSSASIVSCD